MAYRQLSTYFIAIISLWIFAAQAAPAQFLSHSEVDSDPSAVVAGCVNAITGTYSDSTVDIVIPGPEPIVFQMFYCSSDWNGGTLCDSWTFNHAKHAEMNHAGGRNTFVVAEDTGGSLAYLGGKVRREKAYGQHWYLIPKKQDNATQYSVSDRGLTNTGSAEISGRTNLQNQTLSYIHPKRQMYVTLCNGAVRTYVPSYPVDDWTCLPIPFILGSEQVPSGNKRFYEYSYLKETHNHRITLIKSTNHNSTTLYGTLTLNYDGCNVSSDIHTIKMEASDGRQVHYTFKYFNTCNKWYLIHANRPNAPPVAYDYLLHPRFQAARVSRKSSPEGRFQEIDYYQFGNNSVGSDTIHVPEKDRRFAKVSCLKGPVGVDESPIITHRFFYNTGYTECRDAHNHLTIYRYTPEERLSDIERYSGSQKISTDKLFWSQSKLRSRALLEADNTVRSCRYLEYDEAHNVTTEHLLGNLSGCCTISPQLDAAGVPQANGCEDYVVHRTYTKDQFRLLATETLPNGRHTTFQYKPNTNLPVAKLVYQNHQLTIREFHDYDDNGTLIKTIVDDGSSENPHDLQNVTHRLITTIIPKAEAPCVGLPAIVEQHYYDPSKGGETLLSKQVNSYNREGHLVQQDHYDSQDTFSHRLCWEYDHMGNVVLEQDALGQLTRRRYDANGNKIFEQGPSAKYYTTYTYDFADRLIAEERVCHNEQSIKHAHRYDYLGNRIATVDEFGNQTTFAYDDLGRLIQTTPPTLNQSQLSCTQTYDIAGNITEIKDFQGNITRKSYNIRGLPIHVTHPDGTTEHFEYYLDGHLKKHTTPNDSYTVLHYDALGNITQKDTHSSSGQLLFSTNATYKGNLLVKETDANGNLTHFEYDGAGRQTCVRHDNSWSHIEYDALGRKWKTTDWVGPGEQDVRVTIQEYDLLNRVVEVRLDDAAGNIFTRALTQYNEEGQCCATTTFTDEGSAITRQEYNAQGKLCKTIDALGNETRLEYNYTHLNPFNQKVLQITSIDPLGNQTILTHDAWGKAVNQVRKDMFGQETAHSNNEYNGQGQLIMRIDIIKTPGQPDRTLKTEWQYDKCGRIIAVVEAVDTPQRRTTICSYNDKGEKEADYYPGDSSLHYVYDTWGRLSSYYSSDGSVSYRFEYDNNGNITTVFDDIHSTTTRRTYDVHNLLTSEQLANGLITHYQYDGVGRLTQFTLPDQSKVRYDYDANLMKGVTRLDSNDNSLYTHKYLSHDPSGQIAIAKMIKTAGHIKYARDKLGRLTLVKSAQFTEQVPVGGYDAAGNLCKQIRRDIMGQTPCQFTYDPLYQLASEEGTSKHTYAYDSLNNRVQKDNFTCEIDALNQLIKQGENTYQYSPQGHRISQNDQRYKYDALGRLTQFETPTDRWEYQYDSFNRRLSKTHHNYINDQWKACDEEKYLYQDQMEVGCYSGDHLKQFRMLGQGFGAEIGSAVAFELDDSIYAPIHDMRGSVVALVDSDSGEVKEAYRYTAYGEDTTYTHSWLWGWTPSQSQINPWKFASKRYDSESHLINFGRRYFDPDAARWLTPDPRGFDDGPNLYAYVHNNPLTHLDLYGLCAARCCNCSRPARDYPAQNRWNYRPHFRKRGEERQCQHCIKHANRPKRETGCNYNDRKHHKSHQFYVTVPESLGDQPVCIVNGINNSPDEAQDSTAGFAKMINCDIDGVYNSTRGTFFDLVKCALGFAKVNTHTVALIQKSWDEKLLNNPLARILVICHSGGAIEVGSALESYPEELRNRICVVAIAPGKYINPKTCCQVWHYRTKNPLRDLVPRIDMLGSFLYRDTIRELDSHASADLHDHSFNSKTYIEPITRHYNKFVASGGFKI